MLVGSGTKQLSLSEACNTMAILTSVIRTKPGGDAVLQAARDKIAADAQAYAAKHPDEMAAIEAEVEMRSGWYDR